MSAVHNSVETVNAAATAIVTAETRVQPTTHRKKRWGRCWSVYKWFKPQTHSKKKHNQSALAPEPLIPLHHTGSLPHPVPPSTPSQSDPPTPLLPTTLHSPPVAFATCRPYSHDTNPVSPPVPFSTTEPSTASFTPPADSPDNLSLSHHDFRPFLEGGSPIRNLVSPNSVVSNSGVNSPYLDKSFSLKFHIGEVPKLLSLENFSIRNWGQGRDPAADVAAFATSDNDVATNHRLSFETGREEESERAEDDESAGSKRCYRSISFGSIKEFDFDNPKGEFPEKSEWWANEKIIGEDLDAQNNWTFFPLLKSGVV